jgi:hypothetical protein
MNKKSILKSVIYSHFQSYKILQKNFEFQITKLWGLWPNRDLNPLTRNPRRYFSQSDEDGILEKILQRLKIGNDGKIIEFGVGDGRENNSLALISKGWTSYWVGGEKLFFNFQSTSKHNFKKIWVTLDNLLDITRDALFKLQANNTNVDVISMDLDGNDWYFIKNLLENSIYPSVWVCEYNSKFPPGAVWVMPYNKDHVGGGNDYYGASFTAFVDLFEQHSYFPVACSVQGANIFFVRNEFKSNFQDIELTENELYQPPFFYLVPRWGHLISAKTLESIFK